MESNQRRQDHCCAGIARLTRGWCDDASQTGGRQLEDERQRVGNAELLVAHPGCRPFAAGVAVCAPFPYLPTWRDVAGARTSAGARRTARRTMRALHRRGLGGDADRVRLPLRDRRPFGRVPCMAKATRLVADKAKGSRWRRAARSSASARTLAERRAGQTGGRQAPASAVIHTLGHCISQVVVAYSRCGRSAPAAPPRPGAGAGGARAAARAVQAASGGPAR